MPIFMKIQHNLSALNTYGRLVSSASKAEKALEEISSGKRINRSADDAAGLAVSEKLRAQIRGLKQAIRNCQDGANLVQTFEGALNETELIVQRCKQLAEESANGSYDNEIDRAAIQQEYSQLCKEVNNMADTDFNGIVMLNGGRLASVEKSGFGWIDPIELDWEEDSFENNTDKDDFSMVISKLPALDDYTLVDPEEYSALMEFDNSEISVEMVDGTATFSFSNEPAPEKLSIVSKNNVGTVVMETSMGVVEIARVTVPGLDRTVDRVAQGGWNTSQTGFKSITKPTKVTVDGKDYNIAQIYNQFTGGTDLTGDGTGSPEDQEFDIQRKLCDQWITSYDNIARNIRCVVSDDLKHFTITGSMASMVAGHYEGKIYDKDTVINLITEPRGDDPDNPAYTNVKVGWDETTIKPGASFYGSAGYTSTGTSIGLRGTPETHDEVPYQVTPTRSLSLGSLSATSARNYFLAHGNSTFTFTYTEASQTWDLHIENHDNEANSLDVTDQTTVSQYASQLGKSLSVGSTIHAAHTASPPHFDPSPQSFWYKNKYYNYKGTVPVRADGIYSFTIKMSADVSSTSGTSWNSSISNPLFGIGEYTPPGSSTMIGIDNSLVPIKEKFTYKNENNTETAGEGYWEDTQGNKYTTEELVNVGIHIPSKEDRYATGRYLHNGFSITVNDDVEKVNGTATAKVELWKSPSRFQTEDDSLGNLTYAQSLVIQSASRSKDAVKFTFKYSTSGQGDLICDLNCSAAGLGMDQLSLATQDSANKAIDRLDDSLNKISMVRACFGAVHNRLSTKINNITTTGENLTASESQIRDADMPDSISEFTKQQVVTQAASAMLAQANMSPQSIMQLLNI